MHLTRARNLRKVKILLDAVERAEKKVSYFALDLMYSELVRTLAVIPEGTFKHVSCFGLWGTYDDGLAWLKRSENASRSKAILSLGSSIGNFTPEEAVPFLAQFAEILENDDVFMVAIDGCQDPDIVYRAYNDRDDVTHRFTMNGLQHANKLLGYEAFRISDWEAVGRYDVEHSRHRAYVVPKKDMTVEGAFVRQGEMIQIEESNKMPGCEVIKLIRLIDEAKKDNRRTRTTEKEIIGSGAELASSVYSDDAGTYCKQYAQKSSILLRPCNHLFCAILSYSYLHFINLSISA